MNKRSKKVEGIGTDQIDGSGRIVGGKKGVVITVFIAVGLGRE